MGRQTLHAGQLVSTVKQRSQCSKKQSTSKQSVQLCQADSLFCWVDEAGSFRAALKLPSRTAEIDRFGEIDFDQLSSLGDSLEKQKLLTSLERCRQRLQTGARLAQGIQPRPAQG